MDLIWTTEGVFHRTSYSNEADLESAILRIQSELFVPERIYLDVKKKIGKKNGGVRNIPDAYLIDLTGCQRRLYQVSFTSSKVVYN